MRKKKVPEGIMVIEHKKPKGILSKVRENVNQELKFRKERKKAFKRSFREASLDEAKKAGRRRARDRYRKKPGKSLLGSLRSDAGKLGAVQMVYGKPKTKSKRSKKKPKKKKGPYSQYSVF